LKLFNVNESVALAFALIMHISQFILIAGLGLYALMRDGYSLRTLFSQLIKFKEQISVERKIGD